LSPEAEEYLRARGISGGSIRRFALGQVPSVAEPPFDALPRRLASRITIPYILRRRGLLVRSLRFRALDPRAKAKYETLAGDNVHLFNLAPVILKSEPSVYITEGEFDAIILCQMGFAAIGVPGASSFKGVWRHLFREHAEIVLVFDGDEAGQKGANRIYNILHQVNRNVRKVHLPPGMDVTDAYLQDRKTLRYLLV
jgi:DNA primase